MVKVPTVTQCCCCFSLRGGVLFLGYWTTVWGILYFIGGIFAVVHVDTIATEYEKALQKMGAELPENFQSWVLAALITNLIMSVISVACAISLIRGIKTDNKKLMIPWLAVSVFTVGYMVVALIISLVKVPTMAIGICLGLVWAAYLFVCVYSLYREIGSVTIQDPAY